MAQLSKALGITTEGWEAMNNEKDQPSPVLEILTRFVERAEGILAKPDLKKGQLLVWSGAVQFHLAKIYGKNPVLLAGFAKADPNSDVPDVRHELETRVSQLRRLVEYLHDLPRTCCFSNGSRVFIGHGRSPLWRELKDFIEGRLSLPWDEFNREAVAGLATTERLQQMISEAAFAFLVMTAEEEHADQQVHARPNVVHETGLFQGRLGFRRAIILLEEGCTEFSNIVGLTQIRFPRGDISARFEEVRRVLERERLV